MAVAAAHSRTRALIVQLHMYAGLFVFAHLMIYGIAGLVASAAHSAERPKVARITRYVPFTAEGAWTDQQVADAVYEQMKFPLAHPVPGWYLKRTEDDHLLLDFHNINGIFRVIVLENENRLRVEEIRNSWGLFLEDMHAATLGGPRAALRMRIWGVYNEVAMWCLLAFIASGVWLWLSSRPRLWWTHASWIAGTLAFAAFWMVFRT